MLLIQRDYVDEKKYRLMIESCYKRAESDVYWSECAKVRVRVRMRVSCSSVLCYPLFANDDFEIYTFEKHLLCSFPFEWK